MIALLLVPGSLRIAGDRYGEATALTNLGDGSFQLGENRDALQYHEQALPIYRAVGDRSGEAETLNYLQNVYEVLNQPRLAILFGKQSVNVYQGLRAESRVSTRSCRRPTRGRSRGVPSPGEPAHLRGPPSRSPTGAGSPEGEEFFEFDRRSPESTGTPGRTDLTPTEESWEKRYREIGDRLTAIGTEFERLQEKNDRTAEEESRLLALDKDLEVGRQAFQKFLGELATEFGKSPAKSDRLANVEVSETLRTTLGELGREWSRSTPWSAKNGTA